jgi:polyferredoxin
MAKTGRPARLIAYDTDVNIHRRQQGQAPVYHFVRMRTALYAAIITIVGGVMLYTLATRQNQSISVIHDRNPIFVRLADGSIRNGFTIHVSNKALENRIFQLSVGGMPGLDVTVVGDTLASARPLIVVGPDQTRELRALVTARQPIPQGAAIPLTFIITDEADGSRATAIDHFRGP